MIYGNSELTSVPWETIIKVYRRQLGEKTLARLPDYGTSLLTFLGGTNDLFPKRQQELELLSSFHGYCNSILGEIDDQVEQRLANGPISRSQIGSIAADLIDKHARLWGRRPYLSGRSASYVQRVIRTWSPQIDQVIRDVFRKITLNGTSRAQLRRVAGQLYAKDLFNTHGISGVVVAGFGEREHFPSVVRYDLEGVVLNKVKFNKIGATSIGRGAESVIMPFAQREMVDLFMEGVDPNFRQSIGATVEGILKGMPDLVVDPLHLSASSKKLVRQQIEVVSKGLAKVFNQKLQEHSRSRHVDPIVQSVGALPKEELAAMAESLVNLTSFKRRVTRDLETVGGPIDVAVISKGDGFVWIKRKHYFDPTLNAQFLANYTR